MQRNNKALSSIHSSATISTYTVVHVEGIYSYDGERSVERVEKLYGGICNFLHVSSVQPFGGMLEFVLPETFWNSLASLPDYGGCRWIVSFDVCRTATLLDFFVRLESKGLVPAGGGPNGKSIGGDEKDRLGYFVTSDPPNILTFRIPGQAQYFKWIDIKNFGIGNIEELIKDGSLSMQFNAIANFFSKWVNVVRDNELGKLEPTASAQAMTAYRHRFLEYPISLHDNQAAIDLERSALTGGRCSTFYIGKVYDMSRIWQRELAEHYANKRTVEFGPVYHLDFRSLYPYVMRNEAFPVRLVSIGENIRREKFAQSNSFGHSVAEVDINTPAPLYPVRANGRSSYPVGKFRTVLCGSELLSAYLNGHIMSISRYATYDCEPIFVRFIDELWELRKVAIEKKDRGLDLVCKRVMNGLAGKFSQRRLRWVDDIKEPAFQPYGTWFRIEPETGNGVKYRSIAWLVQREEDDGETDYSFPAITAFIMAAARVRLMQAVSVAGWKNVYYIDTDSLFVSSIGYENLQKDGWISENRLGFLREIGVENEAIFYGNKYYRFGEEIKAAGVPGSIVTGRHDDWQAWTRERFNETLCHEYGPIIKERLVSGKGVSGEAIGNVNWGKWCIPVHLTGGGSPPVK